MTIPFDEVAREITSRGFHNHRLDTHSGTVSRGLLRDLRAICQPFEEDYSTGRVRDWLDFPSPAGRERKLDLVVSEPQTDSSGPDLQRLRLCVENKSVITAHRNRTNRYDDLSDVVGALHRKSPDSVLVATVIIGTAERVLNIPDRVRPFMSPEEFDTKVCPRLSSGDHSLWDEFQHAISKNRAKDPERTVEKFRGLPTRPPGRTDLVAYDFVLLVPMFIDNVNPVRVDRENSLNIDVDAQYRAMLDQVCRAYTARWHI